MSAFSSDTHLREARARLEAWLGVDLGRGGVARAVERHVARRIEALGRPHPAVWASMLDRPGSEEARALVEASTVPHSWLFRDGAQLAALETALARRPRGRLAVWIAGCASGEDAYTFASIASRLGHELELVASDVNESALASAREGRYSAFAARELPRGLHDHFEPTAEGGVVVRDSLRRGLRFVRHSLVDAPLAPANGGAFDLVVCRNVLIYFARDAALAIASRLAGSLVDGGLLVLGASDVLTTLPAGLSPYEGSGRLVLVRSASSSTGSAPPASLAPLLAIDRVRPPCELPVALPPPPSPALDDVDATLAEGLELHARGEFVEAALRFSDVCRRRPGAWAVWLHLGLAHERLGRWDEAKRAFGRVALAEGEGEELPRGTGDAVRWIHAARPRLVRFSLERVAKLESRERGGMR